MLQYLVMYGHTGPSQRREVQWSPLLQATMAQFQKPAEEVRTILDNLGTFTIDDGRDVIFFSPQ